MKLFAHAHATHPDWRMAVAVAAAQADAQLADPAGVHIRQPTLGWVYFSDHYAPHAQALLADLQQRWPGVAWVGASGVGVSANGVEYFDEPALVLMLSDLPREQFCVFSGVQPLSQAPVGFVANTAQVHADGRTADLGDLIADMSELTATGYLFGGLASARSQPVHLAEACVRGGLSGVAFNDHGALVSRGDAGLPAHGPCATSPGRAQRGRAARRQPASNACLRDLGVSGREPRERCRASAKRWWFDRQRRRCLGAPRPVRHRRACALVGIDPARGGIALSDEVRPACRWPSAAATPRRRGATFGASAARSAKRSNRNAPGETALALQGAEADPRPPRRGARRRRLRELRRRGGPHFGAPSAELARSGVRWVTCRWSGFLLWGNRPPPSVWLHRVLTVFLLAVTTVIP